MAAQQRLMNMMFGTICSQVVGTAARLGLADHLGEDELDYRELAARTDTHPGALARLLRALAALEIVVETGPGTFRLGEAGLPLRTERPDSQAAAVLLFTDPALLDSWKLTEEAVRTGRPTFETLYGTDFFSFLATRPELSERFNATMRQVSLPIAHLVPVSYDFTRHRTVVDVGGGDGTLIAQILRGARSVRGVVFDSPTGVAEAASTLAAAGVADRCRVEAGDFFTAVPAGGDLYVLKNILHDWDDDRCVTILDRCRAVVPADGRVLIVESVLPDTVDTADPAPYLTDISMLVNMGGQERTRAEYERLCRRAGFAVVAAHPTVFPTSYSLLEAMPV
ncbi:methyltransferase [Nocardia farcinica]|uniref:methyltransferase n=1 Tax=Nocardia farcinica TaxID=37329 RepID=UPI0018947AAC|nr:methyltransferase [Nocardia farcinica]MBF6260279.1 methyltransferase [Nocardia farcinica]MBF6280051.1 methyltransferase [Nocardia farcinica]MBF6303289.1 methyltransferase [Nocardia farcinica]MBF6388331.1 methyltransferase [Nocardia farcinica]MBF6492129.1 methyltransferase [Nocardia farcinica]